MAGPRVSGQTGPSNDVPQHEQKAAIIKAAIVPIPAYDKNAPIPQDPAQRIAQIESNAAAHSAKVISNILTTPPPTTSPSQPLPPDVLTEHTQNLTTRLVSLLSSRADPSTGPPYIPYDPYATGFRPLPSLPSSASTQLRNPVPQNVTQAWRKMKIADSYEAYMSHGMDHWKRNIVPALVHEWAVAPPPPPPPPPPPMMPSADMAGRRASVETGALDPRRTSMDVGTSRSGLGRTMSWAPGGAVPPPPPPPMTSSGMGGNAPVAPMRPMGPRRGSSQGDVVMGGMTGAGLVQNAGGKGGSGTYDASRDPRRR